MPSDLFPETGERAELWPIVVDAYAGYADYQKRTDREILLVLLESSSRAPST